MNETESHVWLSEILLGFWKGQGALRSAFLVKVGISTQAFVGTNAAIGFRLDMARIATYGVVFLAVSTNGPIGADPWPLILVAIVFAFAGVLTGKRFLHKVTMKTVQTLTGVLLLGIALALGAGIV